jgi:hypothetical protein
LKRMWGLDKEQVEIEERLGKKIDFKISTDD